MTTGHVRELIHDYVDGVSTHAERDAVDRHVRICAECRKELGEIQDLVRRLKTLPESVPPPESLLTEIDSRLRSVPRPGDAGRSVNGLDGLAGRRQDHQAPGGPRPTSALLRQTLRPFASRWYVRIAATVLVTGAAGALWFMLRTSAPTVDMAAGSAAERPIAEQARPDAPDTPAQENEATPPSRERPDRAARTPADPTAEDAAQAAAGEDRGVEQMLGAVAGSVLDERGSPASDVVVRILGTEYSAVSDSLGRFAIGGIPRGSYTAGADQGGSLLATQELDIAGGDSTLLTLRVPSNELRPGMAKSAPRSQPASSNTAPQTIAGTITDAATGQPLFGVNVLVVGTTRGSTTDLDGKYTIIKVPAGSYALRASQVGYAQAETTDVRVGGEATARINFSLKPAEVALSEVRVAADAALRGVAGATGAASATPQDNSAKRAATSELPPFSPGVKSAGEAQSQTGSVKKESGMYLRGGRAGETRFLEYGSTAESAPNTERYDMIAENTFHNALSSPLSTFSIDVDNASYANIRRFINDRRLPPRDAVRVEEMINYFAYEYPQPKGKHPFSVVTEISACPWNEESRLLLVGLQGKRMDTEAIPPSNLVFLIDVSGSMRQPNKLPLVKSAFRLLVNELREEDRVSIVVYAGQAGLVLPPTSGDRKQAILRAIDNLQAEGSTAGGEGILLAYRVAKENFVARGNNRVILATDGDFNVGVSSDEDLVDLITLKRKEGISLSVLGFGAGNLKDAKMEKLADRGNGYYAYIDNIHEARRVFVSQMAGTLSTIAKDVKVQIEFNPMKVRSYRLVGYENRALNREDFADDRKDAGDLGAGHSVTALYEIIPANGAVELPDVDTLRYQRVRVDERTNEILTIKLRYKLPESPTSTLLTHSLQDRRTDPSETSENFRFASAVAQFGMLLRDSEFKGSSSFDGVLELARGAIGSDLQGYRTEFVQLVESCKLLVR